MDNKTLDLLEIRDQIDAIDKEIVELFEKRMQLSADVAEYKISNNKEVLDPKREKEKLTTLEHYASNSFNRVGVYELFRQMMAMSRKLQYRVLAEHWKSRKHSVPQSVFPADAEGKSGIPGCGRSIQFYRDAQLFRRVYREL